MATTAENVPQSQVPQEVADRPRRRPGATYFLWENVRNNQLLPEGFYDFTITDVRQEHSRNTQLLMFVIELMVDNPETKNGQTHLEYCVFGKHSFEYTGTDDGFREYAEIEDPEAEDPITAKYSQGMRQFKDIFVKAGMPMDNGTAMEDILDRIRGGNVRVGARVVVSDGNRGPRNDLATIYPWGSVTAKIEDTNTPKGQPASHVARNNGQQQRPAGPASTHAPARNRAAAEQEPVSADDLD